MTNTTPDKSYVVGMDIGGTNSVMGIVDKQGNILCTDTVKTGQYTQVEDYVDAVCSRLLPLIDKYGGPDHFRGMGIGAPNANFYKGTIEQAPNLPWKGIVPLADMFSQRTRIPVAMTNDANAAALGEMTYGAARGMKDFIMITLGTGVGSGIVINGQVVYGHDGFAGELGHVCVDRSPQARLCGCGRRGCLETYCSATGVARTAREVLETCTATDSPSSTRQLVNSSTHQLVNSSTCQLVNSSTSQLANSSTCQLVNSSTHQPSSSSTRPLVNLPPENITSKQVYDAAEQGDELALEIFRRTGETLGRAIADFIAFSSPEAIILFGGLTKAGDYLMRPLREAVDTHVMPIYRGKTRILLSSLKDADAAILGASALGWEA